MDRHRFCVGRGEAISRFEEIICCDAPLAQSVFEVVPLAVLPDDPVRQRQPRPRHEILPRRRVARSALLQMNRVDRRVGPIEQIQRLLEFLRILRALPRERPGRRSGTDVHDRRQTVFIVGRPLPRAVPPAKLTARHHLAQTRGPIPRHPEIPLHVRIVGKQLPIDIEGHVEGIPIAAVHQFPLAPVRLEAADEPTRRHPAPRMPPSIRIPLQQVVLLPVLRHPILVKLRRIGVVAGDVVDPLPVRRGNQRMQTVLATTAHRLDQAHLVRLPVAVAILHLVNRVLPLLCLVPRILVHRDIQHVLEPEQPVRSADRQVPRLRLHRLPHRHPEQPAILVTHHQVPVRGLRHRHP